MGTLQFVGMHQCIAYLLINKYISYSDLKEMTNSECFLLYDNIKINNYNEFLVNEYYKKQNEEK